jgi:hypothetical protein
MPDSGFYQVAAIGPAIGHGITGSRYASLNGVVKVADEEAAYTVPNEYICGLLGMAIGLPVPPGTIARLDDGTASYAMMRFGPKGDKPPAGVASALVRDYAALAARIAVFDCWVLNGDRHPGNFAYVPGEGVSVFDHGHALLGIKPGQALDYLNEVAVQPVWGGVIVPELLSSTDLHRAAEVIRSCHPDLVRDACDSARRMGVLNADEAKKAAEVLIDRQKMLGHFISRQSAVFAKITDWGLGL